MKCTIELSTETHQTLLTLARGQVPLDIADALSDDELIELAVDLLAQSYDASMPDDGGEESEPATAAEVRDAIAASLDPDISTEVEVRAPQQQLNLGE
jgi:hypothetical protein